MAFIGSGGVCRAPFANEANQIDRRRRAMLAWLGLGELDRPTRVLIFPVHFRWLVLPVVWDPPCFDRRLLFMGLRGRGAAIRLASTIRPDMAM